MMMREWTQWLMEFVPVIGATGIGSYFLGRRRRDAETAKIESEARVLLDELTWKHALETIETLKTEVRQITAARIERDREIIEMRSAHTDEISHLRGEISGLRDDAKLAVRRSEECEERERALQARVAELERQFVRIGDAQ